MKSYPFSKTFLNKSSLNNKIRFILLCLVLLGMLVGLIWRLVDLNILDRYFLRQQGNARSLRTVELSAYRGIITDRNGQPLAISTPVHSVWVNPEIFKPTKKQLKQIAETLELSPKILQKIIRNKHHKEFVYLKRRIPPSLADPLEDLNVKGLFLQNEYRRYYPMGEVTAHVVGFTNVDDHGQEGLELTYDAWLAGHPGAKRVIKDRMGDVVADLGTLSVPRPGKALCLSIDYRLQYVAYQILQEAVKKSDAQSGSAVVLDPRTGEILAMVNTPAYNPNDQMGRRDSRYRNRAVTDLFEPGSTIKPFSVANAMLQGHFRPDTKIDTNPGWLVLNGKFVHDTNNAKYGVISVTQVLQHSSNIGVTKMTLSLADPQSLWKTLHALGFGDVSGAAFPGEVNGSLPFRTRWAPFTLATLSFGYGLSVNILQLAQGYAVLAAHGVKRPLTFIKLNKAPKGKQIIKPKIAAQVVEMLESVVSVKGGTAPKAKVPGYRVAGKTGTTRMVGPHGYLKDHHMGLFAGIIPVSHPRLVIAVVIVDPKQGSYYGGMVSAPVFAKIAQEGMRILAVPPDKPEEVAPEDKRA